MPNNIQEQDQDGVAAVTCGFAFAQSSKPYNIPKTWVLINNQSNINLFCNHELLVNIRTCNHNMSVHYSAGRRTTNQIWDLQGYSTVWYHPQVIANILGFKLVKMRYHVSFDSESSNGFIVTKPDGMVFKFKEPYE